MAGLYGFRIEECGRGVGYLEPFIPKPKPQALEVPHMPHRKHGRILNFAFLHAKNLQTVSLYMQRVWESCSNLFEEAGDLVRRL